MKKNLIIFLMGSALIFSGCESKVAESKADNSEAAVESATLTLAERSAKITKQRADLEKEREIALVKLASTTPYYENANGKLVYYKAETDPAYVGGDPALRKFLKANLKFPDVAEKEGSEGTVFVDFIVTENGKVSQATATTHTYGEADELFRAEALRVVNSMPDWSPGLQNGKAVDVKFSVPITFLIR